MPSIGFKGQSWESIKTYSDLLKACQSLKGRGDVHSLTNRHPHRRRMDGCCALPLDHKNPALEICSRLSRDST